MSLERGELWSEGWGDGRREGGRELEDECARDCHQAGVGEVQSSLCGLDYDAFFCTPCRCMMYA